MPSNNVIQVTKEYYNSFDADNFYYQIWGGEDIHIGIYGHSQGSIFEASRRTVKTMAGILTGLDNKSLVLDIGSGYGGAARYLAKKFGCRVWCLNLSEKQNEINRAKNKEKKLDKLIQVVDGNFESLPFDQDFFDVVWSEDAILHSPHKELVFREVARVLKNGGQFIFTDPMQSDFCHASNLEAVLDRIHLDSMGSFSFYRETATRTGFEIVSINNLSEHLVTHYARVKEELQHAYSELTQSVSKEYIDRMIQGLDHWISAGKRNYLTWGIILLSKI